MSRSTLPQEVVTAGGKKDLTREVDDVKYFMFSLLEIPCNRIEIFFSLLQQENISQCGTDWCILECCAHLSSFFSWSSPLCSEIGMYSNA